MGSFTFPGYFCANFQNKLMNLIHSLTIIRRSGQEILFYFFSNVIKNDIFLKKMYRRYQKRYIFKKYRRYFLKIYRFWYRRYIFFSHFFGRYSQLGTSFMICPEWSLNLFKVRENQVEKEGGQSSTHFTGCGNAVERLFLIGKDVIWSNTAGLSDEHFQMMVFVKGNSKF